MIPNKRILKRINKIYNQENGKLTSDRFYRDYCEGYRYSLGKHSNDNDLIAVAPEKSKLEQLLRKKHYHDLSYDLEVAFERTIYSLMRYGKAYIYINAEYENITDNQGQTKKILSALQIGEIRGIITHRTDTDIEFWGFGPIGIVTRNNYKALGLVEMEIKELGYSSKYFTKLTRKLDKFDVISSNLICGRDEGYDFSEHLKKSDIHQSMITRKLGWIPHADIMTQSQYYYRKIQQNKFKIMMLDYVVNCVNKKLKSFLPLDSDGRISIFLKEVNYDELWDKYNSGYITTTELASSL